MTTVEKGTVKGGTFSFTSKASLLSTSTNPSVLINGFTFAVGLGPFNIGFTAQDGFTFLSSSLPLVVLILDSATLELVNLEASKLKCVNVQP